MTKRWIDQTEFFDSTVDRRFNSGNCGEAAIASLLHISLEEVPKLKGMAASEYWDTITDFFRGRGYDLYMDHLCRHYEGYYLASGITKRGTNHMVVMMDGFMLHDPHPSRDGLETIDVTWVAIPLDPSKLRLIES